MPVDGFQETLTRLGLAQYHDALVAEAFESWHVLADITEEDLDALGVKLGHRRILWRAITEYHRDGVYSTATLGSYHHPNDENGMVDGYNRTSDKADGISATSHITNASKRKYRRHPKPDENAPKRPLSAYVLFSNRVRESLKDRGQELSFTEIAKVVGEGWQVLPHHEKAAFKSRSLVAKDRYYSQLAEYKKTSEFTEYQRYLVNFQAKHGGSSQDGKRNKNDTFCSSGRSNSDDKGVGGSGKEASIHGIERPFFGVDSVHGTTHVPWGRPVGTVNTSPESLRHGVTASDSASLSPHQLMTSDITAIKSPHLQPQQQQRSLRLAFSNQLGQIEGQIRHRHLITSGTSLAFGSMPSISSVDNDRPTQSHNSPISATLVDDGSTRDYTRTQPNRHPGSLSSVHARSRDASAAPDFLQGGLSSCRLPSAIPSQLSNGSVAAKTTGPESEGRRAHCLSIAYLLRTGDEQQASVESVPRLAIESEPSASSVCHAYDAESTNTQG